MSIDVLSLPQSADAEEAVLGSVLINPECFYEVSFLRPTDFFIIRNSWVWEAMQGIVSRGDAIDNLTVIEALRGLDRLETIGGSAYITSLMNNTPTSIHAETYGRMVQRASVRRRLLNAAGEIAKTALEDNAPIENIIDKAETALFNVTAESNAGDMVPAHVAASRYFDLIEKRSTATDVTGLTTGYDGLDKILGGLEKSRLYTIGARPGVGKTAFMVNLAMNAMKKANARVAIFSLEMDTDQIMNRIMSSEIGVNSKRIASGRMDKPEWERFTEATERISRWRFAIDDTPNITIMRMRSKIRSMYQTGGLDLVILDYIQLMYGTDEKARDENRVQEISFITRNLKMIAKEFKVPVVCAAQLNRAVEQRQDKRPLLSDLRESGAIEQDSDVVLFLYRDDMYNPHSERPNECDVIIAKNRDGDTTIVPLYFVRETTRFVEREMKHFDVRNI